MATAHPLQSALQAAVDDGTFPGAVLAVRLRGAMVFEGAAGLLTQKEPSVPVSGVISMCRTSPS